MIRTICRLAVLLYAPMALAQLVWENTSLHFEPEPQAASVKGEFRFTNKGDYAIRVLSIKPSCGCTTASLEKRLYQPGESGSIAATFNLSASPGDVDKTISVWTDDKAGETVKLKIGATVKEYVRVTPRNLLWREGNPLEAKSIDIKVVHDEPINVSMGEPDNDEFEVKFETLKAGRSYRITAVPRDTTERHRARLPIVTDFPAAKPMEFNAQLYVSKQVKQGAPDSIMVLALRFASMNDWLLYAVAGALLIGGTYLGMRLIRRVVEPEPAEPAADNEAAEAEDEG